MPYLVLFSFLVLLLMTCINWSKNKTIVFLAFLLAGINIWAILHYWLVIDFNARMAAIFSNHFTPLYLLIGPSIYFYVRGVIKDTFMWKKTDFFHLVPALLQLVLILPYTFGNTYDEKVNLMMDMHNSPSAYLETYFNPVFNALQTGAIRLTSFSIYLIFSSFLLVRYLFRSTGSMLLSIQRHIALRWLLYLHVSLFLILGLYIYLIYQSDVDHNFALSSQSYTVQNSLAFLISINNLSLLLIPEILFGLIIPKKINEAFGDASYTQTEDAQPRALKEIEYLNEISERIDEIMNIDKPFLEKDFRLAHLSSALNVPDHHLASCLRNIKETTFTDLKNLYRIKAFKKRIEKGALNSMTIDGLREECGFQSKSSFYSAFQKLEGMTPIEYLSKK